VIVDPLGPAIAALVTPPTATTSAAVAVTFAYVRRGLSLASILPTSFVPAAWNAFAR
jgi:hypothetical protein